jgi:beta-galactosidase
MKHRLLLISMMLGLACHLARAEGVRERLLLDEGWRFHLGDLPENVLLNHNVSYNNAKAGNAGVATPAAGPDFDDTAWRKLNLPHDWAVEGPFSEKACESEGYRPRGFGWYRRHFQLDERDQDKHIELQFDGIASHCTVWFNGTVVHRNFCGYNSFIIDITPFAKFGKALNTIAIRVDAQVQEGWWYEGAGIYRHTWLVKRNPVHIATYGLYANPVRDVQGQWNVPVEVTLYNKETAAVPVEVTAELIAPDGKSLVSGKASVSVPVLGEATGKIPLAVATPQLWSLETPTLYTVRAVAKRGGTLLDETSVTCGFRTIRFDADKGFFLNDKPVKLKGTCNHQDHAGVGVAVPDALQAFRVRRLKELGSNAYRAAHNPPAPELLEACDRQGLLVMDENRNFNCSPEYLYQLRTMVLRDRNHPSVILWSVFNEEPMQATVQGREMVRRMAAEVRKFDVTRPITAAMNGGMNGSVGVFEAVDVMGFNYQQGDYDAFHKKHPAQPVTSSEDTSCFMTRGEYANDKERNVVSSYDTEFPGWGATHRKAWREIATRPFIAGGFVWTGFDYRGEPQRLKWPSVSSVFGIMDTCGFPKAAYYIHQASWIEDKPVLAIEPHWNWPGKEGQPIKLMLMSNAEKIRLSLNGKELGEKAVPPLDYLAWDVPYAAGKLEAVAFKGGKEVARAVVETTGEAVALALAPDRAALAGDGLDAMPITISAVDAQGRVVPQANPLVTFEVTGPGANIGHGNGDHNCHDPEQGPTRRLFHGLAQLIVQSQKDGAGTLTIKATAPGLKPAEATLTVNKVPAPPALAACDRPRPQPKKKK